MAITKIIADSITSGAIANTPAFRATIPSSITFSSTANTKVPFSSETYDIGSCFNTSNYRFTVPSGQAGKYHFTALIRFYCSGDNASYIYTNFYKNGSDIDVQQWFQLTNGSTDTIRQAMVPYTVTMDLAVNDYIEVYGSMQGGGTLYMSSQSYFEGFKILT